MNVSLHYIEVTTTHVAIGVVLSLITLSTVFGNAIVMAAVLYGNLMRRPQYMLMFSLATTDLLLATAVLPLAVIHEVLSHHWVLGERLCEAWIAMDVLCCTASIWHLVAIALDRYRCAKSVRYSREMPKCATLFQVIAIWTLALFIAIIPYIGWRDKLFYYRISQGKCLMSQNIEYQIFSTLFAFYLPLCCIVLLYQRTLHEAKRRISGRLGSSKRGDGSTGHGALDDVSTTGGFSQAETTDFAPDEPASLRRVATTSSDITIAVNGGSSPRRFLRYHTANKRLFSTSSEPERTPSPANSPLTIRRKRPAVTATTQTPLIEEVRRRRMRAAIRRERRATRTLATLTGTFVACWAPFFVLAIVRPACSCDWAPVLDTLTLWLGYVNSALNPVVYTIFSPDFRFIFKKMFEALRQRLVDCCQT